MNYHPPAVLKNRKPGHHCWHPGPLVGNVELRCCDCGKVMTGVGHGECPGSLAPEPSSPSRPVMVTDQPAYIRLFEAAQREMAAFHPDAPPLDLAHVAAVCAGLADHTAILSALHYSRDEFSPDATSVVRWLHAVADDIRWVARGESK